ncbi:hypothetical protein NS277_08770 [Novosphingobium barchaimii]|nr:hypothetical protein NS277_08770 [Novosphingobium barchaimii]
MKKALVDLVDFASLAPIAMIYNAVAREWGGLYGVSSAIVLLIPVSVAWHYFYLRVRSND